MHKNTDAALLEQARQWQAFISRYGAASDTPGVDWAEEFCLVVHNRLAKLRTPQTPAQVCRVCPGRHQEEKAPDGDTEDS
jgi:hypothetical protein